MQMIGQQHPGVDLESMPFADTVDCRTQRLANVLVAEKGLPAIGDDGEKIRTTRGVGSTIVRHGGDCSRVGNKLPTLPGWNARLGKKRCFNGSFIGKRLGLPANYADTCGP